MERTVSIPSMIMAAAIIIHPLYNCHLFLGIGTCTRVWVDAAWHIGVGMVKVLVLVVAIYVLGNGIKQRIDRIGGGQ